MKSVIKIFAILLGIILSILVSYVSWSAYSLYKQSQNIKYQVHELKALKATSIENTLRTHFELPEYLYFPIAAAIYQASESHGLEPRFLMALIWAESDYKPNARSTKGAYGLTQLMKGTAKDMAKELNISYTNKYDMITNIYMGAYYYKKCFKTFGTKNMALKAYNAGPGNAHKGFKETEKFVIDVNQKYSEIY